MVAALPQLTEAQRPTTVDARSGRILARSVVGLAAVGAGALAAFATARWGVGITTDSTAYIAMARSLLANGTVGGIVHWPPGYPVALALFGATLGAARWLNVTLFVANVVLLAVCAKAAGAPRWGVVAAACYALVQRGFLQAHVAAMSEPLALLGGMGALALGALGLERRSRRLLMGASLIAGIAVLVRYAAVIYPVTIAAGVLAWSPWSLRERRRMAALSGAVGLLPVLLLAIHNELLAGTPGRRLAVHLVPAQTILGGLDVFSGWLVPLGHAPAFRWVLGGVVLVAIGALVVRTFTARHRRAMSLLAAIFVAAYLPFLLVVLTFVDATTPFSERILLPALAAALVLALGQAPARLARWMLLPLLIIGVQQFRYTLPWIEQSRAQGVYYDGPAWRRSALLARVRELPGGVTLYSNGADVIRLLAGRTALDLPPIYDAATKEPNRALSREISALPVGSYVAYFDKLMWRDYVPGVADLETAKELRLVEKVADGAMYRIEKRAAQSSTR